MSDHTMLATISAAARVRGELDWRDPALISNSQVDSFTRCRMMWHAKYILRLRPPETSLRLTIGSAWHLVLRFYRHALMLTGGDRGAAIEAARFAMANIREFIPGIDRDEKAAERLPWMLEGYLEVHADTDADRWEYLTVEHEFVAPIGTGGLQFGGYVDYIKRDKETGVVVAGDTKSMAKAVDSASTGTEITFTPQFMRYMAAMARAGEYQPTRFEWDAARTDMLKRKMTIEERIGRISETPKPAALDAAWAELESLVAEIALARAGESPIYGSIDSTCSWRCDYHRAHVEASVTGDSLETMALAYGFTQGRR